MDPLDTFPEDYGSDRFGYVEIQGAPEGVGPSDQLVMELFMVACGTCSPNLFMRWAPGAGNLGVEGDPPGDWWVTVAHDTDCATFDQLEREGRLGKPPRQS